MLENKFKPSIPVVNQSNNYELTLPVCSNWRTSATRLLIVMQTVDSRDLKAGGILEDPTTRKAMINAIKYAKDIARKHQKNIPNFSYAICNHNSFRHFHIKSLEGKQAAEAKFRQRTLALIKAMKPTHILFSGDLSKLYPVDNAPYKNGWVHDIDGRKVTSTLDFARLMEKQGAQANLLGFWCRHLANLMLGYLPHSIASLKPLPRLVDTIKKFDLVMAKWDAAQIVAVDTETRNLSVLKNQIYTIQFAFNQDPTKGYVIPIDHPHEDNPFSPEERIYIKKALRRRFGAAKGPELVTFNGIFDMRVIRGALKLDICYFNIWEIMAGEHLLDENISSMASLGIKSGNLAAVLCSQGNDHYYTAAFGKSQRTTIGQVSPRDPAFLEYSSIDVVGIIGLRLNQIERSKYQEINGRNYQPYFINHMLYQMSDTVHQLSHLKDAGSLIDRKYLRKLMASDSVLAKAIDELQEEFKTFPEVQEANRQLLVESGFKAGSLFGGGANQWVFSFTKPAHKAKLFFDVMGLKAISKTATGQDAVDKEFIEHYKDRNYLVEKFGEFQESSKLLSTYVVGWYEKLTQEIDGATDSHLRADYKFFGVDTGRLASANPNLQNIPARGRLAKIIKEMFITCDGHLLVRYDYSAHEVRGWAIVAKDKVLAEVFRAGQKLRQQWIKNPTDAIKAALKKEGDIHIQNCFRFFGKWVEKSDPLRDAVKSTIFGLIYGMAAMTLGHSTKRAELNILKAKINEANKNKTKDLKDLERQFLALTAEDRSEYAQGIIDKVFIEFQKGHQWITKMQELATEKFYVYSPLGRIRHLYAAMTQDKRIVSRQVRRGMNAPIQGFASEIAVKASRLFMSNYYRSQSFLVKALGLEGKYPIKLSRIVHDANYCMVPFEMVIPFIHIMQYDATYGVTKQYEDQFGLKFAVEPEIELEVGVKDTASYKSDWSLQQLLEILNKAVDDGIKAGIYTETKEEIMEKLLAPWRNEEVLDFLDTNYPLLNVSLKDEIRALIN